VVTAIGGEKDHFNGGTFVKKQSLPERIRENKKG